MVSQGTWCKSCDHKWFATAADRWMVLWTKSRQEKALARFLQAKGLNFYLPLIERVTFVRGRKLTSAVPLFPGYVFLAGNNEDGYAALTTKRVCQVIKVPDQARLMEELEQIRSALSDGAGLELYPYAVVGRRCRVVKGPFIGIEGMVTDRLGPGRLVLQVNIIGRGASLEIDADILEPVD